jgi:EAL domain-containing protein (putative c-di-GMP-specific phosphodiesterase class I)
VLAVLASTNIVRDEGGDAMGIVSVNRLVPPEALVPTGEPVLADVVDLQRGLEQGELVVHYQPVLALDTGRIVALEALVRWQHPVHGLLLPDAFIDTAERSGLILDLGSHVLGEACRQTAAWRRRGHDLYITVNLSARELADPGLVDRVTAKAEAAGLDPRCLWLEVTETGLVEDVEQASLVLHRLTALGVGIAIDDFGTGWASLTYLRRFPVHALKIDRTFVSGVDHDAGNLAIVRSILTLGAELGVAVVAEGIETEAEAQTLLALGCTVGQGFLYGAATPPEGVALDLTLPIARGRTEVAAG